MLSKIIDGAYYGIRYFIWGPAVVWNDGTITPEGRELDERLTLPEAFAIYKDAKTDFPDMQPRLEPVNHNG
jgi:hypothetical protein